MLATLVGLQQILLAAAAQTARLRLEVLEQVHDLVPHAGGQLVALVSLISNVVLEILPPSAR